MLDGQALISFQKHVTLELLYLTRQVIHIFRPQLRSDRKAIVSTLIIQVRIHRYMQLLFQVITKRVIPGVTQTNRVNSL